MVGASIARLYIEPRAINQRRSRSNESHPITPFSVIISVPTPNEREKGTEMSEANDAKTMSPLRKACSDIRKHLSTNRHAAVSAGMDERKRVQSK